MTTPVVSATVYHLSHLSINYRNINQSASHRHAPEGDPALTAIEGVVGAANLLAAPEDMARYLVDARGRYRGAALCVVRPANTAEVAATVAICARAGIAIVPQGGNTGMCGGATPGAQGRSVIFLAHPEGRRASAKLRALADHLRAAFGDPPYWEAGLPSATAL